jgi:TorA maturation chaperone TorD
MTLRGASLTDSILIKKEWQVVLGGQALVLNLLGKLMHEYPERTWYQSLLTDAIFEEIPFASDQPDVRAGQELLQKWMDANHPELSEEAFDSLVTDYSRLFVLGDSKGVVLAPPWESVHFSPDRLTFQVKTLQVREWYRRYGLQYEQLKNRPDDHMGLELAFLGYMSLQALTALEKGSEEEFQQKLSDQRQFLREHPLKWAYKWGQHVAKHAQTGFYSGIAMIITGVLEEMAAIKTD